MCSARKRSALSARKLTHALLNVTLSCLHRFFPSVRSPCVLLVLLLLYISVPMTSLCFFSILLYFAQIFRLLVMRHWTETRFRSWKKRRRQRVVVLKITRPIRKSTVIDISRDKSYSRIVRHTPINSQSSFIILDQPQCCTSCYIICTS